MIGWLLLLIVIGAVLYAWTRRARDSKPAARVTLQDHKDKGKYHAVCIKFFPSACQAAKQLEDKRFLSVEAPPIPLPECDAPVCKCRYVHFDDRRSGEDRRDRYRPVGPQSDSDDDRRRHPDRRRSHLY